MAEKVIIGNADLWHGDCREILPLLGYSDVLVTDPPYGVNLGQKNNGGRKRQSYHSLEDSAENLRHKIVPLVSSALSQTKRGCVTPGIRNMWFYPRPKHVGAFYYPAATGCNSWGFSCWQPVFYYGKDPYGGLGSRHDSFQSTEPAEKNGHPCPKPVGQMTWIVNRVSLLGETVLDPFAGSGTTGVACAHLGRSFVGIEIDRTYFEIACERIEQAQAQGQLLPPEQPKQAQQQSIDLSPNA